MRFLIAFLFFYVLHCEVALASKTERGRIQPTKAKISAFIASSKKLVSFEEATTFSKELMERHSENNPSNSSRAVSTFAIFKTLSQNDFQLVKILPERFEAFLDFKYQSVFIFLYPKHVFW